MSIERIFQKLRGSINYPRKITAFSVCSTLLSRGLQSKLSRQSFQELLNTFPMKIQDYEIAALFDYLQQSNSVLISTFIDNLFVCASLIPIRQPPLASIRSRSS